MRETERRATEAALTSGTGGGWADGNCALVQVIGADYEPPPKVPGEPDTLLKFLAKQQAE